MSTYTQILYHIVFSTKNRERALDAAHRERLLRYMWGILKGLNCHLYRINAVDDHLHLLTHLHPTIALAHFVKEIKVETHKFIDRERIFPWFTGWQQGYGAFTQSFKDKDGLIEYIKVQEEHHRQIDFKDELRRLLMEAGVVFDEKYLE